MKVAYIVNQYPKVSHSFIRREILALERLGVAVQRIALRGWDEKVVDQADERERQLTSHVLKRGKLPLIWSFLIMLLRRPGRFIVTFLFANTMAEASDRSVARHWAYFAEACVVAQWIERSNATHLHAHFGTNSTDVAMLASALSGVPYSFTAHGSQEVDRPMAIGLGEKVKRAAFVAAVSSFGRSQLSRWVGPTHWSKIHVVPCGLDELYKEAPPATVLDASTFVSVGRLSPEKGQLLLLQALRRVLDEGVECHVVLAGEGEMRRDIEACISELGLQSHVRITGWLTGDEVRREILAARTLVVSSFMEGLPVVIMEAMALQRSVIAPYVGGIPELVLDGQTGWLVPAADVEQLANALKRSLAATPEQLEQMGVVSRQRVLQRHDVDKSAEQLARLFAASDKPKLPPIL